MDLDYVLASLTVGAELISALEAENFLPDEAGCPQHAVSNAAARHTPVGQDGIGRPHCRQHFPRRLEVLHAHSSSSPLQSSVPGRHPRRDGIL